MNKKSWLLMVSILILTAFAGSADAANAENIVLCASTTSTQNSGFFDYILPVFEQKTGIKVRVIAVGTGAAIETGKRGDVDFVFVHAKDLELKAVEEGFFVDRHDVMYNDFVIVGPKEDPSGVKGAKTAAEAFVNIAGGHALLPGGSRAPFVSRGDNSGTHIKELALWRLAGIDPKGKPWYLEVGQGMEKTLRVANEKRAYTLTDRGTWLAIKDGDRLAMATLFEGDPALFNQYGVMAVNPERFKHVKYKEAMTFIDWIISKDGQDAIAAFKDKNGNGLFYPNGGNNRQ